MHSSRYDRLPFEKYILIKNLKYINIVCATLNGASAEVRFRDLCSLVPTVTHGRAVTTHTVTVPRKGKKQTGEVKLEEKNWSHTSSSSFSLYVTAFKVEHTIQ